MYPMFDSDEDFFRAARDIVASGGGCVAQEEPFYVCDLRELAARHARWRDLMPRVEPFYAVKCNDDKLLLRTLAALGTGFDCASRGEIDLVTNLGVAPDRIIYANTLKIASHVRYAASVGVNIVTFDSKDELIKIKQNMPNAQVVLRIRCDATVAQLYFGKRFGCDPTTEAPALLKLAVALGLDVIGVSFHVGSDMQEPDAYARAIAHCRDIPAKDEASEPQTMYCINDGVWGSFNAPSTENPQPCSIWGPTCSPLDCIVPATSLPPLQVGSWLLFKDMGAYTLTNSTDFNGFKKARVKTFVDRCLW
ncbi:hypothetical protein MSG28_013616 [Choristoneura fumiferana]|uniref:Uncharacterized protein n=1 Tax=Choristoneura fumiferana TaxID=7141 RepID=A0ACC0K848_CHOFU|nr:hypothetical protein MSG28_013616 [Choristoneura fumiferana]